MICFYHSADLDGHCSGFIVNAAYKDCELIGVNYGDEFPWGRVKREDVVMVDFALQPFSQMVDLFEEAQSLVWIDHHKSSIIECQETGLEMDGRREVGKAGCELAWEYFFPEIPMPTFVRLLGRYDVWDHSDPRTLAFQYGMRQERDTSPDNVNFWNELLDTERTQQIVEIGGTIMQYQDSENEKYVKACGFDTKIDGLKCIAINKMLTNSKIFDSAWDQSKYDAMLTFGYRKGQWTVSLYTDKPGVDVSNIAKARGGGGHKQAAGFQCEELPFELN